jgi:glycosyltransferase involved in cell wall biosynthesis
MTDQPLVSVAVTTYNGERFLREQLDSIHNQTYNNIEVVVTDDCSIDGTTRILEQYKKRYNLRFYVNERNLGYVRNFERAISLCQGKYIALADQDDTWFPEKIEKLVNAIGDYSLIFSDAILIDRDHKKISDSFKRTSTYLADTDTPFLQLCFHKCIYGCTMLFRGELLEHVLPIPYGIRNHDWWLPIVAAKNGGVQYLDKKLMFYRQHDNNITPHIKNHKMSHKLRKSFLEKYRKERKRYRENLRSNIIAVLDSKLVLDEYERLVLLDALYYLDSFLNNELSIKGLFISYKYKDIFFSRKEYFVLELLHRIVSRIFNLYNVD